MLNGGWERYWQQREVLPLLAVDPTLFALTYAVDDALLHCWGANRSVTRLADLLRTDARIEGAILVGSLVNGGDD